MHFDLLTSMLMSPLWWTIGQVGPVKKGETSEPSLTSQSGHERQPHRLYAALCPVLAPHNRSIGPRNLLDYRHPAGQICNAGRLLCLSLLLFVEKVLTGPDSEKAKMPCGPFFITECGEVLDVIQQIDNRRRSHDLIICQGVGARIPAALRWVTVQVSAVA